jgi:hypothetical protein
MFNNHDRQCRPCTCWTIVQLCDLHGFEAHAFLVSCLIDELDFKEGKAAQHIHKVRIRARPRHRRPGMVSLTGYLHLQVALVRSELERIAQCSNFATQYIQIFAFLCTEDNAPVKDAKFSAKSPKRRVAAHFNLPGGHISEEFLFELLEGVLKLPAAGQLAVATGLAHSPDPLVAAVRYLPHLHM